jgi:uncharacterized DUF497 family protein
MVSILPNPVEEAVNRRKHGLGFSRIGELLAGDRVVEPDDRPLGYEQEARLKITGRIGTRVLVLIVEPVEVEGGDIAYKPVSLLAAERREEEAYWPEVTR